MTPFEHPVCSEYLSMAGIPTPCKHLGEMTSKAVKGRCHQPDWKRVIYACEVKGACTLCHLANVHDMASCEGCGFYDPIAATT